MSDINFSRTHFAHPRPAKAGLGFASLGLSIVKYNFEFEYFAIRNIREKLLHSHGPWAMTPRKYNVLLN